VLLESEKMAAAGEIAGESSGTKTKRLKVAVIHPDLGIGTPSFLFGRSC
jgi:alpha-1,3/alpha-1,6-mannosyltransferase